VNYVNGIFQNFADTTTYYTMPILVRTFDSTQCRTTRVRAVRMLGTYENSQINQACNQLISQSKIKALIYHLFLSSQIMFSDFLQLYCFLLVVMYNNYFCRESSYSR
jgi:hypothetical protein